MSVIDTSVDVDESNFRLQNRRFMLTYRTHLVKEEYISWFVTNFNIVPFIRLAHELGDSAHDYEHTHVVVDFGRTFQSRNRTIFDYSNIHPHIKKILSAKHFLNSKEYLAKEDPENHDLKAKLSAPTQVSTRANLDEVMHLAKENPDDLDLKANPSIFAQVSACANLNEVMNLAIRPSDAPRLLAMYKISRWSIIPDASDLDRIERWQRQLYEIVKITPEPHTTSIDDSKIIVIYDPIGSSGKTWFSKAMWSSNPTKYTISHGIETCCDIASQISSAISNGWDGHCLFVNITRGCVDHKIYTFLNNLHGDNNPSLRINHIVLMINFMPNLTGVNLDRWQIYGLDSYLLLQQINIHDAIHIYESQSIN